MSNTKVVCPSCGTSFALPEHEHKCSGTAIGKDSGLGTVYLTPEKENKRVSKAEERLQKLKEAGVDTSKFMILDGDDGEGFLFKNDNGIPMPVLDNDPILAKIKESGYVFNRHVDPRWITAQMFRMLNYRCGWTGGEGYEDALRDKGYWYPFKFLLIKTSDRNSRYSWSKKYDGELHRLARMERDNDPRLAERGMYFTPERVAQIVDDYYHDLVKYIRKIPTHKMEGKIPYVRIPGIKGMDGKGDVTLSKLDEMVFYPIREDIRKIKNAKTYGQLEKAFATFRFYHMVPIKTYNSKELKQCKTFRETYKALGAYFTCENLIKFHDCKVYDTYGSLSMERSLDVLKRKAQCYNDNNENWRLFYFMKQLIADNNFRPDWK